MAKSWEIYIDTGGTFTDCLAESPEGKQQKFKVLSSSELRGTLTEKINARSFSFKHNWPVNNNVLSNYTCKFLVSGFSAQIISCDISNCILELDKEPPQFNYQNTEFSLTANEEVPILAARIATNTPIDKPLPHLMLKLGTTRATNALLEMKGTKALFVTTKGFKDLLLIGDQRRPHLFSLNIQKPPTFFDSVFEVDERIDASGKILKELSQDSQNTFYDFLLTNKPETVAISLLNGFLNPEHELKLQKIAAKAGINYISVSHAIEPSIKFLQRSQTTVVNAYLQPIMQNYLWGIREKLSNDSSFSVISSAGGMVDHKFFRPVDGLLSGPAGGVTACGYFSKLTGINKILTFDMGGTSTDVSRYHEKPDYNYTTKVEKAEIFAPSINIETVASGGGSVCSYDGIRFFVGPESAGANPGPACYGSGGPLTITDVNLLLGRIEAQEISIPLSKEKAKAALDKLKEAHPEIQKIDDTEILTGFLKIVNEKMASAIKKVSMQKGFDASEYSLLAFGGAGGMHACQIAGELGMKKIIIPQDAGILSALGISVARPEKHITKQILKTLAETQSTLKSTIDELKNEVTTQFIHEGVPEENQETSSITLFLRFKGQDSTLPILYSDTINIEKAFRDEYEKMYGHWAEGREIELESIKIIRSEKSHENKISNKIINKFLPKKSGDTKCFTADGWKNIPFYKSKDLKPGAKFTGPALVLYDTSSSYIESGWEINMDNHRNLLLSHKAENLAKTELDESVQLELFINRFKDVASQMGALLQRTAFSVNIKERLDFSCAMLDADGYLVVNAPHIPVHLGAMGVCVREILKIHNPKGDDIIITNHPAFGGSHLPDVTLVSPVFYNGQLVAYLANRAHHAEIGGKSPGSMPADATNLEEEGVVLEPFFLKKDGRMYWDSLETKMCKGKYPTRNFAENLTDINAAIASLEAGRKSVIQLCEKYGMDNVITYLKKLKLYAHQSLRNSIKAFTGKSFRAIENLDHGAKISVSLSFEKKNLIIDFAGTSPQHAGNMNATPAIVNSVILYFLRLLVTDDLPLNEGLLDGIKTILPPGFLNPDFKASADECPAVVGGNVEISQRLTDTLLKALELTGCSQGTMNNLLFGNDKFGFYETICGGTGAGDGFNGASAVHQHMTNTSITDAEIMENRYPVRINRFEIREGSGGKGKWNGGDGIIRELEFLDPVKLTFLSQHRLHKPYGIKGGEEGKAGSQFIIRKSGAIDKLEGMDTDMLAAGDKIVIETPGGGGFEKR